MPTNSYHPHPKNSTFIGKPNWLVAWYGLILNDCNTLRFREWDQFVGNEASEISKPVATKPVIIATRSKVVSYKGISLSTKSSTSFIINPNTCKPIALRSWSTLNGSVLQDIISKKPYLTYASGSTSLTSENVLKIDQIKGSLGKFWVFSLGSPRHVINLGSTPSQTRDLTRFGRFLHQTHAIRGDDHDRRLSSTIQSRSSKPKPRSTAVSVAVRSINVFDRSPVFVQSGLAATEAEMKLMAEAREKLVIKKSFAFLGFILFCLVCV
ncbi:hypothetical protein LWI29_004527 [Acer saccharum]|uniref:Uncharacterized protein n=1 Tax=Acer saccharum TaxID=4024 RepID=A0AA39VKF2_ACESA|nr:hypothetical protein LWI29_004527 [Acer saccharum]